MDWTDGRENPPICWLRGSAGFGKSAIMQTVAERLADLGKGVLAASFFFLRGAGARSQFTCVIPTLAYHISRSIPETKDPIQHALQDDPTIPDQSIEDQFQKLVVSPLRQLGYRPESFVVVIDALDECDDYQSIAEFLTVLAQTYSKDRLPLKFILASRAEDHLCKIFASEMVYSRTCSLDLELFDAQNDIISFLKSRFMKIRLENDRIIQGLDEKWPSNEQLTALSEKSEGLFIFAATVVSYVTDGKGSPQEKLKAVLDSHLGLDPLYAQVLSSVNRDRNFLEVLAALILITEQLSINSLGHLLKIGTDEIVARLVDIQSLIKIPANNDGIVQLNHTSFRDFLLDERRSNYIRPAGYHAVIVVHCLMLMTTLKMWPEDDAEYYACSQWHYHLNHATKENMLDEHWVDLHKNLDIFLKSSGLEVWINTVLREKPGVILQDLKAVEVQMKVCFIMLTFFYFQMLNSIQDVTSTWSYAASSAQNQIFSYGRFGF